MKVRVLGAAAGGGFPQWNANCEANRRARVGDPLARRATQASIAVTADGERWFVINASPDLREQIQANDCLHPRQGLRSSPITGVVITNGDVDAIAGLLHLREGTPFSLYASKRVMDVLAGNPVFDVVDPAVVPRHVLALDERRTLSGPKGEVTGLTVTPFAVPGKVPLYLEEDARPDADVEAQGEDTIALEICVGDARMIYAANCAHVDGTVADRLRRASLVFFDGTLFRDDEMIRMGVGKKTGRRMGHISMSGPDGAMAALAPLGIERTVFIHVNNTNPALLADSEERRAVEAAGFEVAYDGMELEL